MTLPVVWITEADADLKEAPAQYESIHPDLGLRFALAVDAAVEVIARSPLAFQTVHAEIRGVGVRRFPYGLFFKGRKQSRCGDCLYAWTAQSETVEGSSQRGWTWGISPGPKR